MVTSLYPLCYVSLDFGRSTQMSAIARGKKSEMSRFGTAKCPPISVIVRVRNSRSLFRSFIYAFRGRGWGGGGGVALFRISGVSVITRCRESTANTCDALYIRHNFQL